MGSSLLFGIWHFIVLAPISPLFQSIMGHEDPHLICALENV